MKLDLEETSAEEITRPRHPGRTFNENPKTRAPRPECPYTLNASFNRSQLDQLLRAFNSAVRRQIDRSVSDKLRHELIDSDPPFISAATMAQLAKWCKTENPLYWDGMEVARKISQLLFGCVLDRSQLRV
jgi:hypothetical protein